MTRQSDSDVQDKIKALIENEPDAKERIRLMILLQISNVLTDNVGVVQGLIKRVEDHSERFDTHVEEEQRLLNQGRGAWKVIGVAIVSLNAWLGWMYTEQLGVIKQMQAAIASNTKEIAVLSDRLKRGVTP